jgi:hypothetical protein
MEIFMPNNLKKILMTGSTGFIASLMLSRFREKYNMTLLDTRDKNSDGDLTSGIHVVDLHDPDRSKYSRFFKDINTVVHLAYMRRSGPALEHFEIEKRNIEMAYNVLRSAYESNVQRVVIASSNHAADWYEHNLIHNNKKDILSPYELPLSDNFYGWAKASYEHLAFVFATGALGEGGDGPFITTNNILQGNSGTSRKMEVVMVRIGAPRELNLDEYIGKPAIFKRALGAYISSRDLTQLFEKSIDVGHIKNEYGIPWQVIYGISNNTRAFWSISNAREIFGYDPQDDSEMIFSEHIKKLLVNEDKLR